MNVEFEHRSAVLRTGFDKVKSAHPQWRIRNVAQEMDVSEMELVAAGCGGLESIALVAPPQDIFKELGGLGRVMALTRNEWCVHERHGHYEKIRAGKTMGIVLGPDIDLRLFFSSWDTTWAVTDGNRQSIQFFDKQGMAIHKVYATSETDMEAWEQLVGQFRNDTTVWPQLGHSAALNGPTLDNAPDGLRQRWLAMKDTHEFHRILQDFNVSRLVALQGVGSDLAQLVPDSTVEQVLNTVADTELPFMCFVGNAGMVQIHSGPVRTIKRTGPWLNVLEPHFNLHLDTTAIAQTWIVNRPSDDGWITSLECFTQDGDLIVQFFGARKPGVPELTGWRDLLVRHCRTALAA